MGLAFIIICIVSIVGDSLISFKRDKKGTTYGKGNKKKYSQSSTLEKNQASDSQFAKMFNNTFLALAAYVIKSDNEIAREELECVRKYFRMYYPYNSDQYIEILEEQLEQDIKLTAVTQAISSSEFNDKFQMMNQLFIIAMADKQFRLSEYVALYDIFDLLNLPKITFITIRELFGVSFTYKEVLDFKEQAFKEEMFGWERDYKRKRQGDQKKQKSDKQKQDNYQRKKQFNSYYYEQDEKRVSYSQLSSSKLANAYLLLGIEMSASKREVKKSYRKMAHKYHPDKVAHLGEGAMKQAEIVFLKIKDAYELVLESI